jgi:hypothetical protein
MAYVGTPRYQQSNVYTLASILQGEAGGQGRTGMLAVASVMQNRASMNFSGYGGDIISQALAPHQFQGQAVPGSTAMGVANDLLSGNVSDITGGATYYANPGASSASWARNLNPSNALQIGAHYFTDNTRGIPFTGNPDFASVANSYTPVSNYSGISPTGFGLDPSVTAPDAASYGLDGTTPDISSMGADQFAAETPQVYSPTDTSITAPLDPGIASAAGVSPTDTSYASIDKANQQTDQTFAASQKNSANPQSLTIPEAIDNQTKVLAQDTAATNKAVQGAADTVQQTGQLMAQTSKDVTDKINSSAKNIFTRGAMILTGVVFVAGGLWLFAHSENFSAPSIKAA